MKMEEPQPTTLTNQTSDHQPISILSLLDKFEPVKETEQFLKEFQSNIPCKRNPRYLILLYMLKCPLNLLDSNDILRLYGMKENTIRDCLHELSKLSLIIEVTTLGKNKQYYIPANHYRKILKECIFYFQRYIFNFRSREVDRKWYMDHIDELMILLYLDTEELHQRRLDYVTNSLKQRPNSIPLNEFNENVISQKP